MICKELRWDGWCPVCVTVFYDIGDRDRCKECHHKFILKSYCRRFGCSPDLRACAFCVKRENEEVKKSTFLYEPYLGLDEDG